MLKCVGRIFLTIFSIDVLVLVIGFFIPINDREPQPVLETIDWIVRRILGFPIWLVDTQYPFSADGTIKSILLVIVSDILLSILVWYILKEIKKLRIRVWPLFLTYYSIILSR